MWKAAKRLSHRAFFLKNACFLCGKEGALAVGFFVGIFHTQPKNGYKWYFFNTGASKTAKMGRIIGFPIKAISTPRWKTDQKGKRIGINPAAAAL